MVSVLRIRSAELRRRPPLRRECVGRNIPRTEFEGVGDGQPFSGCHFRSRSKSVVSNISYYRLRPPGLGSAKCFIPIFDKINFFNGLSTVIFVPIDSRVLRKTAEQI